MSEFANVVELEKQYVLQNYGRHPILLVRGDGPYMWDADGKRYLDFIAGIGVNALGQNHPRIVAAIRDQAARLIHTSNLFYNEFQGPLAKRIAETSGLARTFFTNSGTESTEGALKMMKAHGHAIDPEKYEIVVAGKFVSRAQHRRALHYRPAEIPQGFRAADAGREFLFRPTILRRSKRP